MILALVLMFAIWGLWCFVFWHDRQDPDMRSIRKYERTKRRIERKWFG